MKTPPTLGLVTLLSGSLVSAAALAGESRSLGAHEHGVGHFNLAIEGSEIAMELEAPGADIVGFEHAAKSEADRAAIEDAEARLADAISLFVLPAAAGCSLASAEVALIGDHDHDDDHDQDDHGHDDHAHDNHGHDEHAHNDDHDDHDHDDHGHDDHGHDDHGHGHDEHAGHSEFHAEYRLTCSDPSQLTRLEFAYFEAFPNAQSLEVQMIGADGSHGFEATRAEPVIELPGSS